MKKQRRKIGHIIVPKNALAQPHELDVATILSSSGDDVEFIPVSHMHTPDIKFRNILWEIKSPKGSSSRTIENNIRLAIKQSKNIIIDLSRMKLPENKCVHEIRRQNKLIRGKHYILVITKKKKILDLTIE